jgi:hypothetical protein
MCGGDDGDRTHYLLNAIQALSQVSYTPICLMLFKANFILSRFGRDVNRSSDIRAAPKVTKQKQLRNWEASD